LNGPSTTIAGDRVTLTVEVTGGDPPTGAVSFAVGSTDLGSVALDGGGRARLSTSALPVGRDVLRASYGGDTTFASASATLTVVVSKDADSSTTPNSTPSPSASGALDSSAAPDVSGSADGTEATPSSTTALANTGFDASVVLQIAVVLIAGGAVLVFAALRRRSGVGHS
jgi:hypothetical protein